MIEHTITLHWITGGTWLAVVNPCTGSEVIALPTERLRCLFGDAAGLIEEACQRSGTIKVRATFELAPSRT
jgi:hypothetical protein